MEKDVFRWIPYRFFVNETEDDICKLERLAALFPNMKQVIELELFKSNNLSRLVERLSTVFQTVSALDTRDDTLHLFLGPYHIALGPALYAAMRFKNVSKALVDVSRVEPSREKRRHHTAIRRFRRIVRKLILIRSILVQLRSSSILTLYNQYELSTNGIYELVLAGQTVENKSIYAENSFVSELNRLNSLNHSERRSFLLASNFLKINTLLHLLSSSHDSKEQKTRMFPATPTVVEPATTDPDQSTDLADAATNCCAQHQSQTPLVKLPLTSSVNSLIFPDRTKLSRQNTANSVPESINSESLSDQFVPRSNENLFVVPKNDTRNEIFTRRISNEQELIDNISHLLTEFLAHRQGNVRWIDEFDRLIHRIQYSINEKPSYETRRALFAIRTSSWQEVSSENTNRMETIRSVSFDDSKIHLDDVDPKSDEDEQWTRF